MQLVGMVYRLLADVVLLVHFAFIAFVVAGGFAAVLRPKVVWAHVPCAVWGALIEFAGWICPLTPLENQLRVAGGEAGYSGGFIERYLVPVIYPRGLDRETQIMLGAGVLVLNAIAYLWVFRRHVGRVREV